MPSRIYQNVVNLSVGFPSGDVQVNLRMFLRGNFVHLTVTFFDMTKYTSLTSLSHRFLVKSNWQLFVSKYPPYVLYHLYVLTTFSLSFYCVTGSHLIDDVNECMESFLNVVFLRAMKVVSEIGI
jgi:hypothetical protein